MNIDGKLKRQSLVFWAIKPNADRPKMQCVDTQFTSLEPLPIKSIAVFHSPSDGTIMYER